MKVIFLKDVGGVAQRGTVKDISDGYALNLLIPKGLAKQATPEAIAEFVKLKAASEKALLEQHAKTSQKIDLINGKTFEIKVKVNEKGHLFKKIGVADIARAIGSFVSEEMVSGVETIKEPGEYAVTIKAAGATATTTIKVVKDGR